MPRVRIRAFTLIEVLLIVLLLAVTAALAAPMFSGDDATKLRAAAQVLIADLAFAQMESIAHGDDPRVVVFDTVNHGYYIAAESDDETPITNPVGNLPYQVRFGQGAAANWAGVTISTLELDDEDDILGFGIYGQLDQPDPAAITLSCNSSTITITLDPVTGEASVGEVQ